MYLGIAQPKVDSTYQNFSDMEEWTPRPIVYKRKRHHSMPVIERYENDEVR